MQLKIKKSMVDGFDSIRRNPAILLVGLFAAIVTTLLRLDALSIMSNFDVSSIIGKFFFAILILVFEVGLLTVLSAGYSFKAALNLVISKYITLLMASILFYIIIILGSVALFFPGVFLLTKLLFYQQTILLNSKGTIDSLKASWNVTKGNWWRIFALTFFLSLPNIALSPMVLSLTIGHFIAFILYYPWFIASLTQAYLQLKK